jgi:hypothetical protein
MHLISDQFLTSGFCKGRPDDVGKQTWVKVRLIWFLEFVFRVYDQVVRVRLFAEIPGDGLPGVCTALDNGELLPVVVIQQCNYGLGHLHVRRLQPHECCVDVAIGDSCI